MCDIVIDLKNIHKEFIIGKDNKIEAIRGISFCIKKGQFVAIVGRSGSGKSTLMHIMGGLCCATNGSIIINEQNITDYSEKKMAQFRNEQIGFVFQSFFLEKSYSAWENVALPLIVQNVRKKKRKKLAENALKMVHLEERANHKPAQLSGGEMQRVSIARALVCNPDIIFADEPTGNLDRKNGQAIMGILKELSNQGKTVIMVTHNENDIGYCDRIIELEDGYVIRDKEL